MPRVGATSLRSESRSLAAVTPSPRTADSPSRDPYL